uniref:HAD family hydrolase n=1 Tax=Mobiluncus sp. TaxID=47293 RepID=UPI002590CC34|nr:HAD family hydrolase [Mobiluncus sp.]
MEKYASEVERHLQALQWLNLPDNPRDNLVALDIDGTIVDEHQEMTPRLTRNADWLREGGVHICITTGRSVPATLPVVEQLGLESAWIASANGALIGHFTRESGYTLTNQYTFDPHDAVARILEAIPTALIGVEDAPTGFRVLKPFPPGELRETTAVQPLEELLAKPVPRVVVRDPSMSNEAFREAVKTVDFPEVEHAIGWRAWLDINPKGTSKAHGLQTVCENLGVSPAHALALGDGANDIPMLEFAGYGVAMGNARPEVKAAANNTTLTVHEDGAAAVMEALARILRISPPRI